MARLPPVTRDDLPDAHADLFEFDDDVTSPVLNVHRAMANAPRLFEAWSEWTLAVYDEVGDPRLRELAVLAVARALDSRYVWHQHVRIALDAGVEPAEIVAVADRRYGAFSPVETAALEHATACATGTVDDETHDGLARHVSDRVVVALVFLATGYCQVAALVDALAVELEEPFVGWHLENRS